MNNIDSDWCAYAFPACLICEQVTKIHLSEIKSTSCYFNPVILQTAQKHSGWWNVLGNFNTTPIARDKKQCRFPLQSPAGSFSLPPLDARRWCDHENGRGRDSRSQQWKEVTVALTRPSASESGRKRRSCVVRPGPQGSNSSLWPGWISREHPQSKPTEQRICNKSCSNTILIANDQVGNTPPVLSPDWTYCVNVLRCQREMLLTWLSIKS